MGGRSGGKKGIAKKAGRFAKAMKAGESKKRGGRSSRDDGGAFAKRQGGEGEGNRGF